MDEFKREESEEEKKQVNSNANSNYPDSNKPENNPNISPVAAGFIGLFGGFFLYQIVGGLLTLLIFGFDIESAPVNGIRLMTMAGQILFMLLPAIILAKVFYNNVETTLRFNLPNWKEIMLFILGIIILTPLLQNYLYIQNYFIEQWAQSSEVVRSLKSLLDEFNEVVEKTYSNLLRADSIFEGLLIIVVISVSPAFCEEILFRGFIQKSFEFKFNPFWAALITAAFFGIFHLNPYGLIPLISLGLYFGFAAYMSNSIFIPVILHFLNNFTAVILYFAFDDEELLSSSLPADINFSSTIISFSVLLILFGGVIYFIRRYYKQERI